MDKKGVEESLNKIKQLSKEDIEILDKIRSIFAPYVCLPKNLLKEPDKLDALDSYYGVISFYKWHKSPSEHGAWFSPISFYINELKNKFPEEEKRLELIYRKTAYLNILKMEIDYLSKRFDWNKGEEFKEIFLARFENFTTTLVELIMISINLYERIGLKQNNISVKNFKDILPFLRDPKNNLPSYYQSINDSVDLSLYVYIRNCLVHNPDEIEYVHNNQNPILQIRNIPCTRRYGIFDEYIKDEFKHYTKQLKGKKPQKSFQKYIDSRFPYIQFEFWINKRSNVDVERTKIEFKMSIVELSKKMLNDLFVLQRNIFKIINELK